MAETVPVSRRVGEKVKWWLFLLLVSALIVLALFALWVVYIVVRVYRDGI